MSHSRLRTPHSAFIIAVVCLAVFQFSENTADPDLWSHVFFGTQFVQTGKPTTIDYYSWTASGQPSFDHEYLGEAVFGLAYLALGGPGLLLLKVVVGLLTFGMALSIAGKNLDPKTKLVAWAFGALAVVEISFGRKSLPRFFWQSNYGFLAKCITESGNGLSDCRLSSRCGLTCTAERWRGSFCFSLLPPQPPFNGS
jgi:hypothetical protein